MLCGMLRTLQVSLLALRWVRPTDASALKVPPYIQSFTAQVTRVAGLRSKEETNHELDWVLGYGV